MLFIPPMIMSIGVMLELIEPEVNFFFLNCDEQRIGIFCNPDIT